MDGVDQLNNILIIGMTNRKDMIDEALLRPGRLEVHVEISLPNLEGRVQILNIHTATVRARPPPLSTTRATMLTHVLSFAFDHEGAPGAQSQPPRG